MNSNEVNVGQGNKEEMEPSFRNDYQCVCGCEWSDVWSCQCNDRCPKCNREIEPYASEDLTSNDAQPETKRFALADRDVDAGLIWSVGGVWSASLISQSPILMTELEALELRKRHPKAQVVDVHVYLEAHKAYLAGVNSVIDHDERSTAETREAARQAGIKSLVSAGFPENALEICKQESSGQEGVQHFTPTQLRVAQENPDFSRDDVLAVAALRTSLMQRGNSQAISDAGTSSQDVSIGAYNVTLRIDSDGHLTLVVTSNDKSKVIDVGEDIALNDAEFAVRLSTVSIEQHACS